MIRQPEFFTLDMFKWTVELTQKKKPEHNFSKARFKTFSEGLCVQIMHVGPYADEPATIENMREFIKQNGLADMTGKDRKTP